MNAYRKTLIYYFSGTGNSKNVALWLSKVAHEKGIESEAINIAQIDRLYISQPDPDSLVVVYERRTK